MSLSPSKLSLEVTDQGGKQNRHSKTHALKWRSGVRSAAVPIGAFTHCDFQAPGVPV